MVVVVVGGAVVCVTHVIDITVAFLHNEWPSSPAGIGIKLIEKPEPKEQIPGTPDDVNVINVSPELSHSSCSVA